jgi:prepilin-type N-terminal cleavage/methylation domain-containing protein
MAVDRRSAAEEVNRNLARQQRTIRTAARPGPCRRGSLRPAFTLTELIVVMVVIVVVLSLAVPGLSAMNSEARLTASSQKIAGALTRAYYLSQAESSMTAVRFLPGRWDSTAATAGEETDRQHMVVYQYYGSTDRDLGNGNFALEYDEYFRRAREITSIELERNVWAAPLESLANDRVDLRREAPGTSYIQTYNSLGDQFILDGEPGLFQFDAMLGNGTGTSDGQFLNADDFLLVFDPDTGLRTGIPQPFRLNGHVPLDPPLGGFATDRNAAGTLYYQRYGFTGVVLYPRDALVELGADADGQTRQTFLRENGRAFLANRAGGGLRAASTGSE